MGVMTLSWKIVIDCADPHAQAAFWSAALGYTVEDNSVLIEQLLAAGHIDQSMITTVSGRAAFRGLQAVRHPDDPVQEITGTGLGRRLLSSRSQSPRQSRTDCTWICTLGQRTGAPRSPGCANWVRRYSRRSRSQGPSTS